MLVNKRYFPPPRSDAACQLCQDLRIRKPEEKQNSLGIRLQDLPEAAKAGCLACQILFESVVDLMAPLKGFSPMPDEEVFGIVIFSTAPTTNNHDDIQTSPLTIQIATENCRVAELEMYSPIDNPCCWPLVGPAHDISINALSDACMSLASSWLADCMTEHSCSSTGLEPQLPDRIICVGSDHIEPYLYINVNQDRGKYAALSHCWGGKQPLVTNGSSLNRHKQGIPFHNFPKTFQHAILVCRKLKISWLWIDSLCIIQDSKDDWAIQAAKMGDIYLNSHITIATDGAPDSEYGFLSDSRRKIKVKKFQCPDAKGGCTEVYVRKKGSGNRDTFNHHVWEGPTRSPLSTRGWITQESVLAPRILHFTAEEITWECNAQSRCECQVVPHTFAAETPLKLMINELPFHRKWDTLVCDFTDRSLSFPSDRLPALSGLATLMQKRTTASYWAGFWSDTFPQCLLWNTLDRHRSAKITRCISKRINPYQAPTWSWASVTGRVTLTSTENSLESLLENIKVTCTPASPNMYGSLQDAQLRAEGVLTSVRVKEGGHPDYYGSKFHAVSEIEIDDLKLAGGIEPDVQGDGYEICVEDRHYILCIERGSMGMIILRDSKHHAGAYERVGRFFSTGDWLKIATKQELILV